MSRRLLLLGLVLCGIAQAAPPPRIDLAVKPAWKGWTRPGRATEVDVRLGTDTARRVTLEVVGGRQSLRTDLELQPGRPVRLHMPVSSAESVAVSAGPASGPRERLEVAIAQSESPLLAIGTAAGGLVRLEGFQSVALAADDLPRNASAYASVDALILDAPTVGAMDARQLGALLAHAAQCGRIVLLNPDPALRRVLDGERGCGGRALLIASSLADAKDRLESSLAVSMPTAMSLGGIGELARPRHNLWNRVAVALAVYFAAAALVTMFFPSGPVLLLVSALASVAVLALLHAMAPASQLLVWSEGDSGTPLARYQAWQRFPGHVRERTRVPIPPQLASSAQGCNMTRAVRFDFDAVSGRATFAEFDARLFDQAWICYSGSFPMARAFTSEARSDGALDVRNVGSKAWPTGVLLAGGRIHDLPALGPGASTVIGARTGRPPDDAVVRTAMTRTRSDGAAALWELDLGGVADAPIESKGWLLVSAAPP